MKNILSLSSLLFCLFCIQPISAQEKYEKKKVVVLKKEIDENGTVKEKETVLEGEDAEEYIRDMNAEERAVLEMEQTAERTVTINKNVEIDGSTSVQTISYDIIIKEKDGQIKKMKWVGNDESEMPDEIREIIEAEEQSRGEEKEVNVEVKDLKETQKVKIRINEKGEQKEIEFEAKNGEIPDDIKEELKAAGVDPTIILKDGSTAKAEQSKAQSKENRSKGQLGVMIQDDEQGVLITDLVSGSSAQKGGLLPGDIITSVDGKKIKNTGALIKAVSTLYAGDELQVDFIRSDESMSKSFKLKKRTPRTWEEVMRKN